MLSSCCSFLSFAPVTRRTACGILDVTSLDRELIERFTHTSTTEARLVISTPPLGILLFTSRAKRAGIEMLACRVQSRHQLGHDALVARARTTSVWISAGAGKQAATHWASSLLFSAPLPAHPLPDVGSAMQQL